MVLFLMKSAKTNQQITGKISLIAAIICFTVAMHSMGGDTSGINFNIVLAFDPTEATSPAVFPRPVQILRDYLAGLLAIKQSDIEVMQVEEMLWPDTCLGLPSPARCAPGETPGYRVTLQISGTVYRYHTNNNEAFMFAGPGNAPRRNK
jgi:hypothetical protein